MKTHRESVTLPVWTSDALEAPVAPHFESPYFDLVLNSWVVVRHDDVLAALHSPELSVNSTDHGTQEQEAARYSLRLQTLAALSGDQLRVWTEQLRPLVAQRVAGLVEKETVSLIEDYLDPACLDLAALVTEIRRGDAERLKELTLPVSAAAAEPLDPQLKAMAKQVLPGLQKFFHSGTETLRESGFVALAHTLPAMLANACHALIRHPTQWTVLHNDIAQVERGLEELMRYAGLTRFLRRSARADFVLAGAEIRRGDRVILRIFAANHDPARFCGAEKLDVQRHVMGHLTLGAGAHSCVGAGLLRMASLEILRPLLETCSEATLAESVEWRGGSGFCTPRELKVLLAY